MKIIFISNLYPPHFIGGYEQICFDVAQGLRERGHEIHVLTSGFRATTSDAHIGEQMVYRRLLTHENWDPPTATPAAWVGHSKFQIARHNGAVAREMIAAIRPDVVMMWNAGALGRAFPSALEREGRVVYYLHDPWLADVLDMQRTWTPDSLPRRIYHAGLEAIGIARTRIATTDLIFCSKVLQSVYTRRGIDVRQGTVIYNGIDTTLFAPQPQRILDRHPGEPFRILYSGRLLREKGVNTLVRALAQVHTVSGLEKTELSLLGAVQSAEYATELTELIEELELQSFVNFLPRRPRVEVPQVFRHHDLLAFTSELEEAFPLTLLEVMATGLPAISTTTGGSAEIVRDGENALAFRAGDPQNLAEVLVQALQNPRRTAAIGLQAMQEVQQHFTLERQIEDVERYLIAAQKNHQ